MVSGWSRLCDGRPLVDAFAADTQQEVVFQPQSLTFAKSTCGAARLLTDLHEWLDFGDEDETCQYQCYLDWVYAIEPRDAPA